MTTSPDESRPSGVSLYVLPDVLRPRIDAVLADLGLDVVAAPTIGGQPTFVTVPRGHFDRQPQYERIEFPDGRTYIDTMEPGDTSEAPLRFVRSDRIDAPRD